MLLVAKSPLAEAQLGAAFRARSTSKTYVALLAGRPRMPSAADVGEAAAAVWERETEAGGGVAVEAPIGRDTAASNGRMAVVSYIVNILYMNVCVCVCV